MITQCSQNISYLSSIDFLENGCHIGSILMLTLSSYSLYLIVKKSPVNMKGSVPYMINLHIFTMVCDFTWSVLVLPMFFMPSIAAHASGVIVWFTQNPVVVVWLAFASLGGMAAAIISLFEHRHRVIVTESRFVLKNQTFRRGLLSFMYFGHMNFGIPEIITAPENQEEAKRLLFQKNPCLPPIFMDPLTHVIQLDASLFNPHMYLTCLYLAVVFSFFCSHIMWSLLPRNNPSMSASTRKMMRKFFICMCIQVAIPTFVIYLPNLYWNISITFDFYFQEFNNISIVLFTLHGTSSSIATIFIYAPYRNFTKDLILSGRQSSFDLCFVRFQQLIIGVFRLKKVVREPIVVSVSDQNTGRRRVTFRSSNNI
ncbi:hypothetical protein L5515_015016 [Caenorhabditis briggsae]|uniref:Serpentine Receptor, class H n=1 Tax=Caenorhabditis briggsae TaxID=6238 RepID=A0AAE9EEV5_CAEBR|nr:hypothetical protein L5515_015016 [Caenorhabditis briggsae]